MGQVMGLGLPLFVQFDAASGRLLLNAGPAVTQESFAALMQAVSATNQHRMQVMESTIDESGQGLFFWIDAEQAMPSLQMFLQPEQMANMHDMGLDEVRSAAFGWGVANGKGRLAIVVDVPAENSRELLPYVNNDLSAKSVGDPDGLFLVSIPTAAEFARIERLALESASAESQAEWVKSKASFHELAGISIEDILGAVGPEIAVIIDQAGDYLAMHVRDKAMLEHIIERVAISIGDQPDEKRIGGATFFHWSLPSELDWMDGVSADEIGWLGTLMQNQREHFYWTIDGDFLYAASVPQTLIDRAAMGAKTDVGEWLSDKQRIDASHAVLSLTGTSRKLPKRFYAMYIELLQFLADISKTEIDIWSMPTAAQLELPNEGAIGFTMHFGDPYLAVELMFENSPIDGLLGAGGSGIVVVGILAAIAIPAYQDYTIRAKVSEGLSLAAGVKAAITEHYQDNGQFPGPADAALLSIPERAGEYVWSITVEPDTGIIVVVFNDDALPEGGTLYLAPSAETDGSILWTCSGTIEDKHQPAACRDNTPPLSESDGA
jgi:Tfp pilus assembly major pilin PilA